MDAIVSRCGWDCRETRFHGSQKSGGSEPKLAFLPNPSFLLFLLALPFRKPIFVFLFNNIPFLFLVWFLMSFVCCFLFLPLVVVVLVLVGVFSLRAASHHRSFPQLFCFLFVCLFWLLFVSVCLAGGDGFGCVVGLLFLRALGLGLVFDVNCFLFFVPFWFLLLSKTCFPAFLRFFACSWVVFWFGFSLHCNLLCFWFMIFLDFHFKLLSSNNIPSK